MLWLEVRRACAKPRLLLILLGGLLAALCAPDRAQACVAGAPGLTTTFTTVGEACYAVPAGVRRVRVIAVGARGASYAGGSGARVDHTFFLPAETLASGILWMEVGGDGGLAESSTQYASGGFNGGGHTGLATGWTFASGGGGGGASDVRTCRRDALGCTPTAGPGDPRLVVAGGGGGGHRDQYAYDPDRYLPVYGGSAGAAVAGAGAGGNASGGAINNGAPGGAGPGGGAGGAGDSTDTDVDNGGAGTPGQGGDGGNHCTAADGAPNGATGGGGGGGWTGGGGGAGGGSCYIGAGGDAQGRASRWQGGGGAGSSWPSGATIASSGGAPASITIIPSTDTAAPAITLTSPVDEARFRKNQVVIADYSCDDGNGSGVASCEGRTSAVSGGRARIDPGEALPTSLPGTFTFEVSTSDREQHTAAKTVTYVVDDTPPTITWSGPADGATIETGASVQASFSCTTAQAGDAVTSCQATQADDPVANGDALDTSGTGARSVTVTASDTVGNSATKTISYTLKDTTPPQIPTIYPYDGSWGRPDVDAPVSWTCDDGKGLGIQSCTGTLDGKPVSLGDPAFAADGTHVLEVTAQDAAGNTRTRRSTFTVDANPPTVTFFSPVEGERFAIGEYVTFNAACSDDREVAQCWGGSPGFGNPIDTGSPGEHTILVEVWDRAGNYVPATVHYVVDSGPPSISPAVPAPGGRYRVGQQAAIAYSCSDDDPQATCVGDQPVGAALDTSTPGVHRFAIESVDGAGQRTERIVEYVVDDTMPTITFESPVEGGHVEQGVVMRTWYSCDDPAGADDVVSCSSTETNDWELLRTEAGDATFTVVARDRAGNETRRSITVKVSDTLAPAIFTAHEGQTYELGQAVSFSGGCSDAVTANPACSFTQDGKPLSALDTASLGTKTIAASSEDDAGNARTAEFTYTVVDTTAPAVTVTSPQPDAVFELNQVVNADFACADPAETTCVGSVADGAPLPTGTPGPKTLVVDATDASGNTTRREVPYVVSDDATPPQVTVTSPLDGSRYKQGSSLVAGFSCTDTGGSTLDTCVGDPVDSGGSLDTSGEGARRLTVTATDKAGNTRTKTIDYVVDGTAPAIGFHSPADGDVYRLGADVTAKFACDAGPGDQAEACEGTVPSGQPIDTGAAGAHTFTVTTADEVGNHRTRSVTYHVDPTPPLIAVAAPLDGGDYRADATISADFACTDSGGLPGADGVASCTATQDGAPVAKGDALATGVGEHTLEIVAVDRGGNESSRTVAYEVFDDFEAPYIGFSMPSRIPKGATDAQWKFGCFDAQPVVRCEATANGQPVLNGAPVATGEAGPITVEVTAADSVGNESTESFEILIDDAGPAIQLRIRNFDDTVVPEGSIVRTSYYLRVDFSCDDPDFVVSCEAEIDGEPLEQNILGERPDGPVTVTVTGTDAYGFSTTRSASFVIDGTAPEVTIEAPAFRDGSVVAGAKIPVVYACSDAHLVACVAHDEDGNQLSSGDLIDTSQVSYKLVTVEGTDAAGGLTREHVSLRVIDLRAFAPVEGATYALGEAVKASYRCGADDPDITTCAGPVASGQPIDTATPGPKTFAVKLEDRFGNSKTATIHYTVADAASPSPTPTPTPTPQPTASPEPTASPTPATPAPQPIATPVPKPAAPCVANGKVTLGSAEGRITAAALLGGKKAPKKLKLKRARGGVTLTGLPKRTVKIRLVIKRAKGKTVRRTVTVTACA